MESKLKVALNISKLKDKGISASGCINEGSVYETENGFIFVKKNFKEKAQLMFDGEFESLKAISGTNTIRVPKPLTVVNNDGGGAAIAMEYIKMSSLRKHSKTLGELLARMHVHNATLKKESSSVHKDDSQSEYVENFGFHVPTCCGYIPQENSWKSDWVEFFSQNRLEKQINLIAETYGDREAIKLWSELQLKVPSFFKNISITPALLHGDLWSGNAGEAENGPVIYDPASYYGHSESELSISKMFGGFSHDFFEAYHNIIPKEPGFQKRSDLYQLFHYLNHWNHFGGGYKGPSISLMKKLIKD